MTRVRLFDLVNSELPSIIGCAPNDVPKIASAVNRSQESLLADERLNEQGPPQGYAEMVFAVNRRSPYITCPRDVDRLLAIDVCSRPTPLRNQWFEFLEFGDGRMPKSDRWEQRGHWWSRQGYTRNNSALFEDLRNPPQQIQVFWSPQDCVPNPQTGALPRALLQGTSNGIKVVSQDNGQTVQGEFVTAAQPYSMSVNTFDLITGIQKDATQEQVQFFQSDPQWGTSSPILTMEPGELTAWYRRYYIHELPASCCPFVRPLQMNPPSKSCGCPYPRPEYVQVSALAKLALVPVVALTDYLLVQSAEAIIRECQALRMGRMDDSASQSKAIQYHNEAIRILIGQGISQEGKNNVSVNFNPYGRHTNRRVNLRMR